MLERKYGGHLRARLAAKIIQRAYRRHTMEKQFQNMRNAKHDRRQSRRFYSMQEPISFKGTPLLETWYTESAFTKTECKTVILEQSEHVLLPDGRRVDISSSTTKYGQSKTENHSDWPVDLGLKCKSMSLDRNMKLSGPSQWMNCSLLSSGKDSTSLLRESLEKKGTKKSCDSHTSQSDASGASDRHGQAEGSFLHVPTKPAKYARHSSEKLPLKARHNRSINDGPVNKTVTVPSSIARNPNTSLVVSLTRGLASDTSGGESTQFSESDNDVGYERRDIVSPVWKRKTIHQGSPNTNSTLPRKISATSVKLAEITNGSATLPKARKEAKQKDSEAQSCSDLCSVPPIKYRVTDVQRKRHYRVGLNLFNRYCKHINIVGQFFFGLASSDFISFTGCM